jgi:putative glutamine amidotransferase|nr:gamma-glutamyl-gamma-aminobutyrate hydrolase family protein [Schleiferilactobacillus harbinensis]
MSALLKIVTNGVKIVKPIIAITADSLVKPSPVINENIAPFAPRQLVEGILAAGGIPIVLPFPEDPAEAAEAAQAVVDTFDGLVIPGGPDIDPTLFGEEPIPQIGRTNYERDAYEIALIKAAALKHKAQLGICRGIQIIDVAFGGTLYQDLGTQDPDCQIQHSQKAPGQFPTHHVTTTPGSQINAIIGAKSKVNSRHHQAVRAVATPFKATATAPDGVIEAIELQEGDDILAVQWHPENMWQRDPAALALFQDLVARAGKKA